MKLLMICFILICFIGCKTPEQIEMKQYLLSLKPGDKLNIEYCKNAVEETSFYFAIKSQSAKNIRYRAYIRIFGGGVVLFITVNRSDGIINAIWSG